MKQFITTECYYCQWEHGAKEYFKTIGEAIARANEHSIKTERMTEEDHQYWLKQKFFIGKELTVTQQIDTISFN